MNKKLVAKELLKIAKCLVAGQAFDATTVDEWVKKIQEGIKVPYIRVTKSTLGGPEKVSIMIVISVDEKKDWKNDILQNSRYFHISLDNDGVMEMFGGYVKPAKYMRKTRVKSVEEAIDKINNYADMVKKTAIPGYRTPNV